LDTQASRTSARFGSNHGEYAPVGQHSPDRREGYKRLAEELLPRVLEVRALTASLEGAMLLARPYQAVDRFNAAARAALRALIAPG
jgi:hypothetical protein